MEAATIGSACLLRLQRISSLMIGDLESQKLLNSLYGVGIRAANAHARASLHVFDLAPDLLLQPLHHRSPRWYPIVNEHRHFEISGGERSGDVFQVRSNLVPAVSVIRIVGQYLN